jgi:hypothetical protein
MSPSSKRSRFFVKVVGVVHVETDNQRNSRWYCSCSMSNRSLRMEQTTCSNSARNNCSGGIDGRPVDAYRGSNKPISRVTFSECI